MPLLKHSWDIYYRMPSCTDWTIAGYTLFHSSVQDAETLVYIMSNMNEYMGVGCLIFIMKEGILPIWECAQNIDGGVFACGVPDLDSWKNVVYAMCGHTLFSSDACQDDLNGISLLSKKGALVFKLWFRNDKWQRLDDIASPIPSISLAASQFQYHHVPTAIAIPKHRPSNPRPDSNEMRPGKKGHPPYSKRGSGRTGWPTQATSFKSLV
jgi:hypothetical protein